MSERIPPTENLANSEYLLSEVKSFQAGVRDDVRTQLARQSAEELSKVVGEGEGDVSYKIDAHAESHIDGFARSLSTLSPLIMIAEGFGRKIYPAADSEPKLEVIIDPVDGTRGIMYDMRSAWVITGIAPHKDGGTTLDDIEMAVLTEIPPTKQDKASVLYAVKGQGAFEELWDLREGGLVAKRELRTSKATDLKHGFATFVDFFPGSKREIADLSERVFEEAVGPVEEGKALVFDDQYICNAGQVYLLTKGVYRFVADLRPEMEKVLNRQGKKLGMTAHPYDLAGLLIAKEAGAIVTNAWGQPVAYPLDTSTNCSWIGYANEDIRKRVEPVLLREIQVLHSKPISNTVVQG